MKLIPLLFLVALTPSFAATIELVAGGGTKVPPCAAAEVELKEPFGVEFTPAGEMIIVEMTKGERVLRLDKAGTVHHLAGTGRKGFTGDGSDPKTATFNGIHNLAILPDGTILLADSFNQRVRRISSNWSVIDTFAGDGRKGFAGDGGVAAQATIGTPMQVALDAKSELLYIADLPNRRIRRVTMKTGIIDTVAGSGKQGVPTDGQPALEQPLVDPRAVVPDRAGGFYILDRNGNALLYVEGGGKIKTVAGSGKKGLSGDAGPALQATLNGPKHICLDRDGSVLIADAENHVVRRYSPKTGLITRVAGTGKAGAAGVGGDPLLCELRRPHGVTIGPDDRLYITDSYNDRVLRIVP
ncbi:MAG: hypothetical protein ABMA13_13055 [Chthoniobacteraceae bacterium]